MGKFSLLVLALVVLAVQARMELASLGLAYWDQNLLNLGVQRLKQLGVTNYRFDAWMQDFHPCRGEEVQTQGYANLQRILDALNGAGIKVQITFGAIAAPMGIPTKGGQPCPGIKKALGINPTPAAFGKFVAELAPWLYARGVRRFALYNEPNLNFFLCAGQAVQVDTKFMEDQIKCKNSSLKKAAKLYAALWKSGMGALKALQKAKKIGKVQVLFGEIAAAHHGMEFMKEVTKYGKIVADGIAVHPYQFCTPPNSKAKPGKGAPCTRWMPGGIAWLPEWKKAVSALTKAKKLVTPKGKAPPLYLTEFGYLRSPKPANIPESFRAKWFPMALSYAKKQGAKQLLIFGLNGNERTDIWDSGILEPNTMNPLPSFNAIRAWAQKNGYKQSP